jgi:hypothetical protein
MGVHAPDALLCVIDRFDLGRKVFLSCDYGEGHSSKAETPHEADAVPDALVYELCGLAEEGTNVVTGEPK